MAALVFLFACWLLGSHWLSRVIGSPARWYANLQLAAGRPGSMQSIWPARLAFVCGAFWLGAIPVSWLIYLLAYAVNRLFPQSEHHPLLAANTIGLALVFVLLLWLYRQQLVPVVQDLIVRFRTDLFFDRGQIIPSRCSRPHGQPENVSAVGAGLKSGKQNAKREIAYIVLVVLGLIGFSCWLIFSAFYRKDGYLAAGYSIFSDFAPHTALTRSFSAGRNWPTQYPHFAGDGISYHFMFFFMCGNLNYLGLPLDLAINLPSLLGMICAMLLLGFLAVVLTRRLAAWGLVMLLTLARSSMAFFTHLANLIDQFGWQPRIISSALRSTRVFIGSTPRDDWGLWSVNVYANQRHLLPAVSILLLVLLLFLPLLKKREMNKVQSATEVGHSRKSVRPSKKTTVQWMLHWTDRFRKAWLRKDSWLDSADTFRDMRGPLTGACTLILMPFWHGSTVVASLLILLVLMLFSRSRILIAITGVLTFLSAQIQTVFFSGGAYGAIRPAIQFGFISGASTLKGMLSYLAEMMGIALPLFLLVFLLPGRVRKITMSAFLLPILFAFTVSLTPDVTVNHKYIMLATMLANIWLADLLLMIGSRKKTRAASWLGRSLAIALLVPLLVTGLMEWKIYSNINRLAYSIRLESPLNDWIIKNTSPDAIFITAPYHLNSFYLTGRGSWLGHSYYAWSAGHDTKSRLEQEQWLLAGGEQTAQSVRDFATDNRISYLLIDDVLRQHDQFSVNEDFFLQNFPLAASFPQMDNTHIFDLR